MSKNQKIVANESWSVLYRPKVLEDLVGQDNAVKQIRGMIKMKSIPQALLITGSTGSGKTTLARIIANTVNDLEPEAINPDLLEINIGDKRTIDDMRGIAKVIRYKPQNNLRIILLDEVHQLVAQSASALLKPLEEPPEHAIWILCTDKPEKLLPTIVNRCTKIHLEEVKPDDILTLLKRVYKKEKLDFGDNYKKVLRQISESCSGQPRESLQLLQRCAQLVAGDGEADVKKALADVFKGGVEMLAVKILLAIYANNKAVLNRTLNETTEYTALMYHLLEINSQLLDNNYNARNWYGHPAKKLFELLKEKKIKASIDSIIKVHNVLVDTRNTLSLYGVAENHLLKASLNKLNVKKD